jgi:hypothetical protein
MLGNAKSAPLRRRALAFPDPLARLTLVCLFAAFSGPVFADKVTGSGFFVTRTGFLLTAHHVIEGAIAIEVRDATGVATPAEVVRVDADNDLALLRTTPRKHALPLSPAATLRKGEEVLTVGYPLVGLQGQESKVTNGIVSSLTGIRGSTATLQITVPIQPGNSGGPLVSLTGNAVGLISHRMNAIAVALATGALTENVNYAVKSNLAFELVRGVPQAAAGIVQPRRDRFPSIADLADFVDRATAMIIVDLPAKPRPPSVTERDLTDPYAAAGRRLGFFFREDDGGRQLTVVQVLDERVRLQAGDVIDCVNYDSEASACRVAYTASRLSRIANLAANKARLEGTQYVTLRVLREGESSWRSVAVRPSPPPR